MSFGLYIVSSLVKHRPPNDLKVHIYGCFNPPLEVVTGTVGFASAVTTPMTTRTSLTTTTGLVPTTTTMNYCAEEKGMNQPLTILPNQVTSNPPPETTTTSNNINPISTTPGLDYPSKSPEINVTLDQPATLTLIYIPVDRPNYPSNVIEFVVQFIYPNNTISNEFVSKIPSEGKTTTTPSAIPPSETTTPSPTTIALPSDKSPQVDLPPNFQLEKGTTIKITITSTKDESNVNGVCKSL